MHTYVIMFNRILGVVKLVSYIVLAVIICCDGEILEHHSEASPNIRLPNRFDNRYNERFRRDLDNGESSHQELSCLPLENGGNNAIKETKYCNSATRNAVADIYVRIQILPSITLGVLVEFERKPTGIPISCEETFYEQYPEKDESATTCMKVQVKYSSEYKLWQINLNPGKQKSKSANCTVTLPNVNIDKIILKIGPYTTSPNWRVNSNLIRCDSSPTRAPGTSTTPRTSPPLGTYHLISISNSSPLMLTHFNIVRYRY